MIIIDITDVNNYEKKDWPNDILIFSDEWEHRNYQCQNFINAHNNIHLEKIHGRKCVVKEIKSRKGKDFLSTHHIQGSNNLGVIFFGLFYKKELIGVMSLGRHNRQIADNRIVLDRFCIANGIHVQGGASKLFKRCVEWAKLHKYDEIISFSDNRLTKGHIYEVLGFELEKNHKPDYCYVDTNNSDKRISKQSQKKSSSKCPEGMTEFEWADVRGLKKLWDKGKKRWVFPLDPSKKTWKQKLSQKCAEQNRRGDFKHSHVRGYFASKKCKCDIYYGSSYELRCLYLLEQDDNVSCFKRADVFVDSEGRSRNPDFQIDYIDNSKEIVEVKPESRFHKESDVKKQISETKKYADLKGFKFSVWTEKNSGLHNDRSIINWAKKFIAETTGNTDWINKQKENDKKKAKKHYDLKIATDNVEFFCKYCSCNHTMLRLTYNRDVFGKEDWVCHMENARRTGRLPKDYLRVNNPYAAEGKKQCRGCNEIKLIQGNFTWKSKPSEKKPTGTLSADCNACRTIIEKQKYHAKKNKHKEISEQNK